MNRATAWLSALLALLMLCTGASADYLVQTTVTPQAIATGQSGLNFAADQSPISLVDATSLVFAIADLKPFSSNMTGVDTFNMPVAVALHFTDPATPGSTADAIFHGLVTGTLANRFGNLTTTNPPLTVDVRPTDSKYYAQPQVIHCWRPGLDPGGLWNPDGQYPTHCITPADSRAIRPLPRQLCVSGPGPPLLAVTAGCHGRRTPRRRRLTIGLGEGGRSRRNRSRVDAALSARLPKEIEAGVREEIVTRILAEARVDEQVAAACRKLAPRCSRAHTHPAPPGRAGPEKAPAEPEPATAED